MKKQGFILMTLAALAGLTALILFSPVPAEAKGKKAKAAAPPAEAAAAEEEGGGRVILHKVRAGEELHMLAGYYYRDTRQWPRIYRENRDQIKNPNRIPVGTILAISVPENWQPYMPYDEFFNQATAGGAPAKAPEAEAAPVTEEKKL